VPRCPHCHAADSDVISLFGTQAMTLQYRCRACGTCYEALKYEDDLPGPLSWPPRPAAEPR
jgi:hypothetical protein